MGITIDNMTNNNIFIDLLADWMVDNFISFDITEKHFRYFAYFS